MYLMKALCTQGFPDLLETNKSIYLFKSTIVILIKAKNKSKFHLLIFVMQDKQVLKRL